jgi:hypothetical protein
LCFQIFDEAAKEVAAVLPEVPKELTKEELMAKKRAEIMANLAKAKAEAEAKELAKKATPATHYGTHTSITCDGCGVCPLEGYRYHCGTCANHDLCEDCYNHFDSTGNLRHVNKVVSASNLVELYFGSMR